MTLRLIGYWKNDKQPELPDAAEFVDEGWSEVERDSVANYFGSGTIAWAFMGRSPCRICGSPNGSVEYTDGQFLWPEGFAHYIRDHNVRPPDEVVQWALRQLDHFDHVDVDTEWWLRTTSRT